MVVLEPKEVYWKLDKLIDIDRIEGLMTEFLCLTIMLKYQEQILDTIENCEGERKDRANRLSFEGFLSEFLGNSLESRVKELEKHLYYGKAKEEKLVKEGKEKLGIK